jgi:hypothetical protein
MSRCSVALLLALPLLAGCLGSLHPLVTDEVAYLDSRLEGVWSDSTLTETAVITRHGDHGYHIAFTDDQGETGHFLASLGRFESRLVLDVRPEKSDLGFAGSFEDLMLPLHGFIFLDSLSDRVHLQLLGIDSLDRYLEDHPAALSSARVDDELVLTGDPVALHDFLGNYLAAAGALSEPELWVRHSLKP